MTTRRRTVKMLLSGKLLDDLDSILAARKIKLSEVVELYLRSLVNGVKSGKAVGPEDEMPIGKYKGVLVGTIIRAEPKYIGWLIGQEGSTLKLTPEALELLEQVMGESE